MNSRNKAAFLSLMPALSLVLLFPASTARAFVYETAFEMDGEGDFDGNGLKDLVIVDKATGNYRVGFQVTPGVFTWVPARASGIANATGLGIGHLNSLSFDSLALTGPDANRINILDATSVTAAGLPVSAYVPSLGPNSAAVTDIGGPTNTALDDLYVSSIYNGTAAFRQTLIRNNGGTNQTVLSDSPLNYLRERANAILLHTNRPPRLGLFERMVTSSVDYFTLADLSTGSAVNITSIAFSRSPGPCEYVSAQFDSGNPYTQVLVYPPGAAYLFVYQVTEPTPGVYGLSYTNGFGLADYLSSLFVLATTNGNQLLALNTNGTTASVYSFDGEHSPSLLQQINAPSGEHFTGAGVMGRGGFMAYSAPLGQGVSARFHQWTWTGAGYSNSVSGNLPTMSAYTASGNVMQFRFEPFVTNNPTLVRLNNAGDWADSLSFSGSPGNVSALVETYLSATQGLAHPTPLTLGAAHPLAGFGLANQYSNMISLFSFTPPAGDKISDVTISPQPGIYPHSIQLGFTAATSTDQIHFRIGGGAWNTWSNGMVTWVFTNTTVQYYGQPSSGAAKSLVKSAGYSFTAGPATLDSNGDGIPDYVKIARGLNVTGSRDSDGDGYSDLEELIHGTNPLDAASVPTNFPHLDDQAVFDLHTTPQPWDGFANASSLSATGMVMHVYDLQGSLLAQGTGSNTWPVVPVTNVTIVAEDRMVSESTDLHYNILTTDPDKKIGREMISLVPLPRPIFPPVPYVFAGGNITNEALNWIASASNVLNNLPRAMVSNTITVSNTLESMLFELEAAQLLGSRGFPSWTNLTLFPSRPSDAGRTNPPQSTLLSLESATTNQPGYLLQSVFGVISNAVETSPSANIASLRAVLRDIYRIDSLLNNSNPATFISPVDETRYFLWHGGLDSNYLAHATTSAQFAGATAGIAEILGAVSGRPTTNVFVTVRADTLAGPCHIVDLFGGGATFSLLDSSGLPFSFPNNFQMLPGTVLEVGGYTDLGTSCGYPTIQVTSAALTGVPISTDSDANGNLLVDSWENKFFGGIGLASPFADADGDGYSNLQEMLEQSDPRDFYGRPTVPPVHFAPPMLSLQQISGQVELHFTWPAAYVGRFTFGVRHTASLSQPFTSLAVSSVMNVSGDEFKLTFAQPPGASHFYYLTVALQ